MTDALNFGDYPLAIQLQLTDDPDELVVEIDEIVSELRRFQSDNPLCRSASSRELLQGVVGSVLQEPMLMDKFTEEQKTRAVRILKQWLITFASDDEVATQDVKRILGIAWTWAFLQRFKNDHFIEKNSHNHIYEKEREYTFKEENIQNKWESHDFGQIKKALSISRPGPLKNIKPLLTNDFHYLPIKEKSFLSLGEISG